MRLKIVPSPFQVRRHRDDAHFGEIGDEEKSKELAQEHSKPNARLAFLNADWREFREVPK